MKIIKLITVTFEKTPKDLDNFQYLTNDTLIKFHSIYKTEKEEHLIFTAELKEIDFSIESDTIKINKKSINNVNKNLEDVINLISLSQNTGKNISSPRPSIFLESENLNDTVILRKIKKMSFDKLINLARQNIEHTFDLDFCLKNFNDRLDGVKIYSEANSAKTSSGKFREYIRLFEKGFKSSNSGLIKPLAEFLLSYEKLNYDKSEIENWINMRNKSVHANCKEGFLIEREIISLIPRLEQAAIDILFNKSNWGDRSINRKNLFEFKRGIKDSNNNIFLPPLSNENLQYIFFDESKTFPVNLKANFDQKMIPINWWYQKDKNYVFENAVSLVK